MEKVISAVDANRSFSRLLRDVRGGESYVITSHGAPVARIVPITADDAAREAAREAYFQELEKRPASYAGKWTRDELYDE
jgi:prevent-host-death family protein